MEALIKPRKLQKGDTIATISVSGGRAGDADLLWRYEVGKKRLEDIFGLSVIETPNALRGSQYLYKYPEARAEDLMWAFKHTDVKAIIANMGGDDLYRLVPYIDFEVIRQNPKIVMGYSDISTLCACCTYAGIMSYYGPNVLTPIAQPGKLDTYTEQAIWKTLFSDEAIGEIEAPKQYTPIEWKNKDEKDIIWTNHRGYKVIQGEGKVRGRLMGGCSGPLIQIMGTEVYPSKAIWQDSIIFMENLAPYGSALAELHHWRALAASGIFERARALITMGINTKEEEVLKKFLKFELRKPYMPVLTDVAFVHRTPMTILPIGAMAEVNCDKQTLTILESGVS